MDYVDSQGNDLVPYELEVLDPDWKSKLLYYKHDLYGSGEWRCEFDADNVNEVLELFLRKAKYEEEAEKKLAGEWCRSLGRGNLFHYS